MNRKLTKEQAQAIIARVASGETQKGLALEFQVSPATVSKIVKGKSWPSLERPDHPTPPPKRKLSEEDVLQIIQRLSLRETPTAIALDYNVTRQAIADIKNGKSWTHIPRVPRKERRKRVWER